MTATATKSTLILPRSMRLPISLSFGLDGSLVVEVTVSFTDQVMKQAL